MTLRQDSLARSDRLRLPEELVESILTEMLSDAIHEAFTFAMTWTFDSRVEPMPIYKLNPWSHLNIVRAWQAYDGKVLSRLEYERNFELIQNLAHTSRQFRRIVEYVVTKICPTDFYIGDEDDESKSHSPLMNALQTLQNLFDQLTEVVYNASQEKHKRSREVIGQLETKNAAFLATPFAKVHYMNAKVRSYIYTLRGPSYFGSSWDPVCLDEVSQSVKDQFDMDPWHRRFLSQSMFSLAHSYSELELGATTQELQKLVIHNQIRGLEDQVTYEKFVDSGELVNEYASDAEKAVIQGRKMISESINRLKVFRDDLLPIADTYDQKIVMFRPMNAVVAVLEERLSDRFWTETVHRIKCHKNATENEALAKLSNNLLELVTCVADTRPSRPYLSAFDCKSDPGHLLLDPESIETSLHEVWSLITIISVPKFAFFF